MAFALSARAIAAGYRLAACETVGSTSAEAMSRAQAGDPGPLWVVSAHQTDGRGRRGSVWQTPAGNLAASLLLTTDLPPTTIAQLGFVAGVALIEALEGARGGASSEARLPRAPQDEEVERCPKHPHADAPRSGLEAGSTFALKWPNDVLAGDAKLAGILLETDQVGAGRAVVVGIGVNVVAAPGGLPYRATSLREIGCAVDAGSLFASLSERWVSVHRTWNEGAGFEAVRSAWLARATGLGAPVAVRNGQWMNRGTFETIDGQGQLVLREPDGAVRRVSAGEVHFGAAATVRPEAFA